MELLVVGNPSAGDGGGAGVIFSVEASPEEVPCVTVEPVFSTTRFFTRQCRARLEGRRDAWGLVGESLGAETRRNCCFRI